jgi:hypothetical protein
MTKNEFIKLCYFYEVTAKYRGKKKAFFLTGDPIAVKILKKVLEPMNIKEFQYI